MRNTGLNTNSSIFTKFNLSIKSIIWKTSEGLRKCGRTHNCLVLRRLLRGTCLGNIPLIDSRSPKTSVSRPSSKWYKKPNLVKLSMPRLSSTDYVTDLNMKGIPFRILGLFKKKKKVKFFNGSFLRHHFSQKEIILHALLYIEWNCFLSISNLYTSLYKLINPLFRDT